MIIEQRKFEFCSTFSNYPFARLIVECPECTRLFGACCVHKPGEGDVCHIARLVFTDGACSNNGLVTARAGLGITMGGDEYSWSISVDNTIDPDAPRTNQRAELLAVMEGLKKQRECDPSHYIKSSRRHKEPPIFVVITDSEYVVKGITTWFPSWRKRGWRTSDGKRPGNLDLFMKLDEYVSSLEQEHIKVGFLHVPRAHNQKADLLAKRGVRNHDSPLITLAL